MRVSREGLNMLIAAEGFRVKPYLDTAGILTVGVGHIVKKGDGPFPWSRDKVERVLREDLARFERPLSVLVGEDCPQHAFDALVNFSFNVGLGWTKREGRMEILALHLWSRVVPWMKRYIYVRGVVSKGLVSRRGREVKLLLDGIYP